MIILGLDTMLMDNDEAGRYSFELSSVDLLEIERAPETPRAVGLRLFNIAATCQAKQDFPPTPEYFERAMPSFRLTSNQPHIAASVFRMGLISEETEQPEKAKQYFQTGVEAATGADIQELVQKAHLRID